MDITNEQIRILLATIKFLGRCPCPRCLICKTDIRNFGTDSDRRIRQARARRDDQLRRDKVEKARKLVYEKGISLASERVDNIIGPHSLVATRVCDFPGI